MKKNKEDTKFSASSVFGVTDEKYEEIHTEFQHKKIDSKTVTDLAELLDINNSGELGVKIFLWSRFVERNNGPQSPLMDLLEKMHKDD